MCPFVILFIITEEAGVPEENRPWATGKLYHLRLRVECALFVVYFLQSWVRINPRRIGDRFVELLGNPTTGQGFQ